MSDIETLATRLTTLENAVSVEFAKLNARLDALAGRGATALTDDDQRRLRDALGDEFRDELTEIRTELIALAERPATIGADRGGFTSVEALHGVGQKLAQQLAGIGIATVGDLLVQSGSAAGRTPIMAAGLSEARLRPLYRQADLLRLHGIGQGEVLLLEAVGIDSTARLATQAPRDLYETLVAQAEASALPPPALAWVGSWVQQAQQLPPIAHW